MAMLQVVSGNIFDSKLHVLVCPVNTKGVMGAGLAKAFAQKFPMIVPIYKDLCKHEVITIGNPIPVPVNETKIVVLFATKVAWQEPSRLVWIQSGLVGLRSWLLSTDQLPEGIALPMLGCGLGGLESYDVMKLIEMYLGDDKIECRVEVYSN